MSHTTCPISRSPSFVFFGTPEFAAIILGKLMASGFIPACVICNPDRPVGRKKIITPPPVKQRIMNYDLGIKNEITVLQPETLDTQFQDSLFKIHDSFDLFIVAAYSKIIPREILDIPKHGAIGVHPSLLPKYRGASPIQTAILNGETGTGVTLFLMDEKVDHGPIIAQEPTEIGADETYPELHDRLAKLGGKLLVKTLPDFLSGKIKPQEQNHANSTMTKKFETEDGYITPKLLKQAQEEGGKTAKNIFNKIRALGTEPGVWTTAEGKRRKLLGAELTPEGKLKLTKVQVEGKKPQELP